MKFDLSRQIPCLALVCAMLLSISTSAQTFVRYVVPSDIGTRTLYSDSVLSSVTLPWGVSRVDNNPSVQDAAFELADILRNNDIKLLRVFVCGSASPDGLWQDNVNLSQARTDATVRYLRHVTGVPVDRIHQESLNEDWDRLYEMIAASDIPCREDVLNIIRTKTWGERKRALQAVGGGKVWRILLDDFFPKLRCVRIAFYCQWDPTKPYLNMPLPVPAPKDNPEEEKAEAGIVAEAAPEIVSRVDTVYIRDTIYYMKETVYLPQTVVAKPERPAAVEAAEPAAEKPAAEKPVAARPEKVVVKEPKKAVVHDTPWMLGFKTNLIGDAMAVPALGAEIQLGRRLSLDIQGFMTNSNIFNSQDKNTNVYGISPELRLWVGGNTMRQGQFVGLHARCAWYTLQWRDGLLYQNGPENVWEGDYHNAGNMTPAWSAGITYGYSLGLGKRDNWGIEFLIGIGYAKYRQNVAACNGGVWEFVEHQNNNHFGVTRAGINLTYRFSVRKVNTAYYENN